MVSKKKLLKVSSLSAVTNSFYYDFISRRWFVYLLTTLARQKDYLNNDAFGQRYPAYKILWRLSMFVQLSIFLVLFLPLCLLLPLNIYWSLIPLGLAYVCIQRQLNPQMRALAELVVRQEDDRVEAGMMTLFHFAEVVSQKYSICSLVDVVCFSDFVMRRLFLLSIVWPWPSTWYSLIGLIVIYHFFKHLINTPTMYTNIIYGRWWGMSSWGVRMANVFPLKFFSAWFDLFRQELKGSAEILNSYLSVVVGVFLCDLLVWNYYVPDQFFVSQFQALLFANFFFSIFIFSGLYGQLIDFVRDPAQYATLRTFLQHVKKLGLAVFCVSAVFLFVKLVVTSNATYSQQFIVHALFDLAFIITLSYVLFYQQYKRDYLLSLHPVKIGAQQTGVIVGLCVGVVFNHVLYLILSPVSFYGSVIFIFIGKYLFLLLFLYVVSIIMSSHLSVTASVRQRRDISVISPVNGGNVFLLYLRLLVKWSHLPLSLVIKSLSPEEYSIQCLNNRFWSKRYVGPKNLVAITCYTVNSSEAYKIAKDCKAKGATVVIGGAHVHFMTQEGLAFCDSVVVGPIDSVWAAIVKDFETKQLKPVYYGQGTPESEKKIHAQLLQSSPGMVSSFLLPVRGCKFNCSFCAVAAKEEKIVKKPVNEVVDLIKIAQKERKTISFLGDNIFIEPKYAKELIQALIPLNVGWAASCSIDIAENDEMVELLRKSNCRYMLIGYEVVSHESSEFSKGKFNYIDHYVEYTNRLKRAGIKITASFIFGFDTHTYQTFWDYWAFYFKISPYYTGIALLLPYPGTAVFDQMIREERLLNMNWQNYDVLSLVYIPKNMNYYILQQLHYFNYFATQFFSSKLGFFVFLCAFFVACLFFFL
ncbi:MAG: radical SAM protein [Candidatus Omnitrophica bacterium]|nr:radical SAM protein [Candidatus Omnitrophota bacterium]